MADTQNPYGSPIASISATFLQGVMTTANPMKCSLERFPQGGAGGDYLLTLDEECDDPHLVPLLRIHTSDQVELGSGRLVLDVVGTGVNPNKTKRVRFKVSDTTGLADPINFTIEFRRVLPCS